MDASSRPCDDVHVFDLHAHRWACVVDQTPFESSLPNADDEASEDAEEDGGSADEASCVPGPRYNHRAAVVQWRGRRVMAIVGGFDENQDAVGDAFALALP
jgi:hypothetical protein